jgi:hypothetical protein
MADVPSSQLCQRIPERTGSPPATKSGLIPAQGGSGPPRGAASIAYSFALLASTEFRGFAAAFSLASMSLPSLSSATMIQKVRHWSIWKKLTVFPLIPVLLIELFCAWAFITETILPVRLIDGRPDDAPRMAALFLSFLAFVAYIAWLIGLGVIRVAIDSTPRPQPPEPEKHPPAHPR